MNSTITIKFESYEMEVTDTTTEAQVRQFVENANSWEEDATEEIERVVEVLLSELQDLKNVVASINAEERVGVEQGEVWAYADHMDSYMLDYTDHGDAYFYISYHKPMMPAHQRDYFATIEELVTAMAKWQPLSEWQIVEME